MIHVIYRYFPDLNQCDDTAAAAFDPMRSSSYPISQISKLLNTSWIHVLKKTSFGSSACDAFNLQEIDLFRWDQHLNGKISISMIRWSNEKKTFRFVQIQEKKYFVSYFDDERN